MLPILIVLGATGALLEIKRLVGRPPNDSDLYKLQQSEEKLKRVLQEVQRELQQEKSEHGRDQAHVEELQKIADELRAAQAELARRGEKLEQKAIGLTEENRDLHAKVKDLQAQHAEALKRNLQYFQDELETLKQEVAGAFEAFSEGSLSADSLLEKLTGLGVEVELTAEDLQALPKATGNDGSQSVREVELQVDSEWRSHLRLLTDDPERMARQLAESAHRAALPSSSKRHPAFPVVRTPPKDRRDGSIFSRTLGLSVVPSQGDREKENVGGSERLQGVAAEKEPLKPAVQESVSAPQSKPSRITQSRKPPTPTRKKHNPVPRLGLSVVLRGDQVKSSRDAFAMDGLSIDDNEHHLMHNNALRR